MEMQKYPRPPKNTSQKNGNMKRTWLPGKKPRFIFTVSIRLPSLVHSALLSYFWMFDQQHLLKKFPIFLWKHLELGWIFFETFVIFFYCRIYLYSNGNDYQYSTHRKFFITIIRLFWYPPDYYLKDCSMCLLRSCILSAR